MCYKGDFISLQGKQETLQSFLGKCLSKHTHTPTHTHTNTNTRTHAHTHTHPHPQPNPHPNPHTNTHTLTYTHTQKTESEYHISNCRLSHLKLQSITSQKTYCGKQMAEALASLLLWFSVTNNFCPLFVVVLVCLYQLVPLRRMLLIYFDGIFEQIQKRFIKP